MQIMLGWESVECGVTEHTSVNIEFVPSKDTNLSSFFQASFAAPSLLELTGCYSELLPHLQRLFGANNTTHRKHKSDRHLNTNRTEEASKRQSHRVTADTLSKSFNLKSNCSFGLPGL